jgi:hypothetical protein
MLTGNLVLLSHVAAPFNVPQFVFRRRFRSFDSRGCGVRPTIGQTSLYQRVLRGNRPDGGCDFWQCAQEGQKQTQRQAADRYDWRKPPPRQQELKELTRNAAARFNEQRDLSSPIGRMSVRNTFSSPKNKEISHAHAIPVSRRRNVYWLPSGRSSYRECKARAVETLDVSGRCTSWCRERSPKACSPGNRSGSSQTCGAEWQKKVTDTSELDILIVAKGFDCTARQRPHEYQSDRSKRPNPRFLQAGSLSPSSPALLRPFSGRVDRTQ